MAVDTLIDNIGESVRNLKKPQIKKKRAKKEKVRTSFQNVAETLMSTVPR